MWSKLMMIFGATFLLAGCASRTATVATECDVWRPISWSVKDTDRTIAEVKSNNARQKAWCDR